MIVFPLALFAFPGTEPAAIDRFKACLTPIVAKNDRRADDYLTLEKMLAKIKRDCASQRLAARDALSAGVASHVEAAENRQMPDSVGWQEELIDEATIRWMNNVTASSVDEIYN